MASASPPNSTPMGDSTEANGEKGAQQESSVTDEQWKAMKRVIDNLYTYRQSDGHDPSKVFHRKVNKRVLPDYYEVIKDPIALSTLKSKVQNREYGGFAGFVRDCALIPHNAQTYNRPEAGAYQDALVIKGVMEKEFQQLAEEKIISAEDAVLPDLGEIPPVSPRPVEEEEEEDEEDEEDDEDEEADDSEEEGGKRKRRRGPRSLAAITKREGGSKDDLQKGADADPRKKRGRPPRVDTPMEARIKAVLKGIRKYKNDMGQIMIHQFEKLPDKTSMPEYYHEIKEPIAIEIIKRKQKRKKYQSVDHFMRDIDTMFNNAKSYNQDESQIYKDAVLLQTEAHKLAEAEKSKPDDEYVMEEGRLPLPNGILHNGELWKVGDWVHIQNPNDVTKPIVAQIYRTWQDSEGQKWVNACWYYRPEQTVHQYEKHFYPNEVVKTGQYRDHHIDEVIDRCFVMFCTRYSRGRPRGLPKDKEVYVCDSRYNEEKHKMNKIKTWASCLPDEVRDKDYEMDLFDGPKRTKKVPTPLLHMLKDDAKETDEVPKPRWGADNAPPIVGAVHKGPRDENQSPPPEPTPSPPPQPPPSQPRQTPTLPRHETPNYRRTSDMDTRMANTPDSTAAPLTSFNNQNQSYNQTQVPATSQGSASPAPVQYNQYATHTSNYAQTQHHGTNNSYRSTQYDAKYPPAPQPYRATAIPGTTENSARPYEVFRLSEQANAQVPKEVRQLYQQDEHGNVLFFTTPPVDVLPPTKEGSALGHTARYLAEKLRRKMALKEKRKAEGLPEDYEEPKAKKVAPVIDGELVGQVNEMRDKALKLMVEQMQDGTEGIYKTLHGADWEEGAMFEAQRTRQRQLEARRKQAALEETERRRKENETVSLAGTGVYLDDLDPRY
ncbi:MAG: hypothetical protein L6R39_004604 [Caloplaca ligustica]|nr:MAG: hypothetical protein L6R39_004604 [Caloplaca ligustica]